MIYKNNIEFALQMDKDDPLNTFRNRFHIPKLKDMPSAKPDANVNEEVIYFCGNSLGLQPKTISDYINKEIDDWKKLAIEGHLHAQNPWYYYHNFFSKSVARIVGAKESEVVVMNSLTVNLHLMMVSFYRPTKKKYKILIEAGAFPSDQYVFESQVKLHGFNPDDAILELKHKNGETTLNTNDIIHTIEKHKDELALIIFGGVNYYTGQAFDMQSITKAGHEFEIIVGFDLAHAAGNLKMQLHDWDVDFAAWCSYKYLNSGPGGVAGIFVHERHGNNPDTPRFAGWWGYDEETRFLMKKGFKPQPGAAGWQLSNAPVFPMAIHKASLDIFDEAGMDALCSKRDLLTGYMEFLIDQLIVKYGKEKIKIITPRNKSERGCQLSIVIKDIGKIVYESLIAKGVFADWREPDVIRAAPVPLYNKFEEVFRFIQMLKESIEENINK